MIPRDSLRGFVGSGIHQRNKKGEVTGNQMLKILIANPKLLANLVGFLVLGLSKYGIDVSDAQQAEIVSGLAAIGLLINMLLDKRSNQNEGK